MSNSWVGTAAFAVTILGHLIQLRFRKALTVNPMNAPETDRTILSDRTIAIIRATAPIVESHVARIVNRFYITFFRKYPEMKALFSLSHSSSEDTNSIEVVEHAMAVCPLRTTSARKNVTGMQARAMAQAVVGYVSRLADHNLAEFSEILLKIANKHVSHDVTPDMYPMLGDCLLESIFVELDQMASKSVINAWTDAYWFLAEQLMREEYGIKNAMLHNNSGWVGFKSFIVRKQIESESICSVYLSPEDGQLPLPLFLPGQYITLRIVLPNGTTTHRNYSLSDAPGKDFFRISVKRIIGGEVSQYIHDVLRSGDRVSISVPCGTFTMKKYFNVCESENNSKRMPIVFISAGIGNTPFMSMLKCMYSSRHNKTEPKSAVDRLKHMENEKSESSFKSLDNSSQSDFSERLNAKSVGSDISDAIGEKSAPSMLMVAEDVLSSMERLRYEVPIILLHGTKNKRHDAFLPLKRELNDRHKSCTVCTVYSAPRPNVDIHGKDYHLAGHIGEALLRELVVNPEGTVFFLCGPERFMNEQYQNILAIGGLSKFIFYERFAPGLIDITSPIHLNAPRGASSVI